jgi:hypothetical protein
MAKRKTKTTDAKELAPVVRQPTGDGFVNLAAKMGVGANNLLSQGQYAFNPITLNRLSLEAMYRTSWVVGVVVDAVADDMTRAGVDIKSGDDPKDIQRLERYVTQRGVWSQINDAIKWGRLYGGAIACIDIDGQDPSPSTLKLRTQSQRVSSHREREGRSLSCVGIESGGLGRAFMFDVRTHLFCVGSIHLISRRQ